MKKGLIIFAASVAGINSKVDKTLSVRLSTQEIPGDVAGLLFGLQNAVVMVAIKEEDFGEAEKEMLESVKADPLDKKPKSKCQELRHSLYRLWQVAPGNFADSEEFYKARMEAIIAQVQQRIDEAKP